MKKIVIANWGTANEGKTTSIKKLFDYILLRNPTATVNITVPTTKDIKVIITLSNGDTIGIATAGDPNGPLPHNLTDFVAAKCDAIICCTRTDGATVFAVDDLFNHGYDIVWVTNYRSNEVNRDILNQLFAEHIYEMLQKRIYNLL